VRSPRSLRPKIVSGPRGEHFELTHIRQSSAAA
jgi:hypothetical protein